MNSTNTTSPAFSAPTSPALPARQSTLSRELHWAQGAIGDVRVHVPAPNRPALAPPLSHVQQQQAGGGFVRGQIADCPDLDIHKANRIEDKAKSLSRLGDLTPMADFDRALEESDPLRELAEMGRAFAGGAAQAAHTLWAHIPAVNLLAVAAADTVPPASPATTTGTNRACPVNGNCAGDARTVGEIRSSLSGKFAVKSSASMRDPGATIDSALVVITEKEHDKTSRQEAAVQLLYRTGDHLLVELPAADLPAGACYGITPKQHGDGGCFGIDTSAARGKLDASHARYQSTSLDVLRAFNRQQPRAAQLSEGQLRSMTMAQIEVEVNYFTQTASDADYAKVLPQARLMQSANQEYNGLQVTTKSGRDDAMIKNMKAHSNPHGDGIASGYKTITVVGHEHRELVDHWLASDQRVVVLTEI